MGTGDTALDEPGKSPAFTELRGPEGRWTVSYVRCVMMRPTSDSVHDATGAPHAT